MLLSTAGLLVRSFEKLQQENPGFMPGGVITARLSLPNAKYVQPAKRIAFADAALARLRSLPGVTAAGLTDVLPFTGNNSSGSYKMPEVVLPAGAPLPHGQQRSVDPGYFKAMGLTLLRGRLFTAADTAGTQKVVIIDRVLADRYWPGQDPLGKSIIRGGSEDNAATWTIVGVVAPVKVQGLDEEVKKETIYYPFAQATRTDLFLVIKTAGDPTALASAVRETVRSADPEQPVFDVKTMQQRMDEVAQSRKAPMVLLSLFSGVALLLAVLGVYGVLAFSVTQRTSEFGVRIALGASPGDIATLVLRQGARLIVRAQTTLLHDDLDFLGELVRRQGEVGHPVGFQAHHLRQARLLRLLEIARVVLAGEGVLPAAERRDLTRELARPDRLGALEHHVLERVGNAGGAIELVERTGAVPDHVRHRRRPVIFAHDQPQAIR